MKMNFKYIIIALTVLTLGAISCSKKEEYKPAQVESGAQYYFASGTPTAYTITPDTKSFEVPIYRAIKGLVSNAVVTVKDTSKTVFAEGSKVLDVFFGAQDTHVSVSLPIDYGKYEFGDLYGLTLEIKEETTAYAPSILNITIELPEPWTSLGNTAKYIDKFFGWETELTGIEILQNDLDKSRFKIVNPYKNAPECTSNGYIKLGGEPEEEITFQILKKGDQHMGVDITVDDLVYFEYRLVGYVYDDGSNSGAMEIDHPSDFSSLRTEDKWLHNKVLSYQENGLPAQVQFAPMYYISGLGGFNQSQKDDMITITFPGVVVADYKVDLSYEGLFTDKEGKSFVLANLDFVGADVTDVALAIGPAKDLDALYASIEAGGEDLVVVSTPGAVRVPIDADSTPGKYAIMAVPYDAEGTLAAKFVATDEFVFGNLTPLQMEYTGDDFIDGISKEKLFGTEWTAYATDDESTPVDREFYSKITFKEEEDESDDVDLISATGFSYGGGAYYGFDDTLYMEYYQGVIYTLANDQKGKASGHDVYPTYVTSDNETDSFEDDYLMCGAYVAEGIIAIVTAEDDYDFTQICFGAYKGGNYAGWFTCMNYILLVDPEVYPDPAIRVKKAKAVANQMRSGNFNGVELDRTLVK